MLAKHIEGHPETLCVASRGVNLSNQYGVLDSGQNQVASEWGRHETRPRLENLSAILKRRPVRERANEKAESYLQRKIDDECPQLIAPRRLHVTTRRRVALSEELVSVALVATPFAFSKCLEQLSDQLFCGTLSSLPRCRYHPSNGQCVTLFAQVLCKRWCMPSRFGFAGIGTINLLPKT
jgi:hypothetical protein